MDGTTSVPSIKGRTILESLESAQIPTHSQCRDGFCGACRCKLLSGEISYTVDPLAFIDDNEVLLCCSIANSDINIEID